MFPLKKPLLWLIKYGKAIASIIAGVGAIGGVVMHFLQRLKLKRRWKIQSLAGVILMWKDMEKKRVGAIDVVISDDQAKVLLEREAGKLSQVMNYLVEKGRARRVTPKSWILK